MQLDIRTEEEEEYLNNPHREEEKEVDLKAEYDEYEEYEVQVQGSDNEDIQSEGVETAENVEHTEGEVEDEDEQDDTPTFLPGTPLAVSHHLPEAACNAN